ncbi:MULTISPECIES: hypothetical protein [Levilactobacillus]|uniref:hypothetical protein n=1 Tax=Levilactobacillus TaxID=2767886 RepID=UPI00194E26F8|nr:hypothetical protein [Levilactobacillus sp. 244-2]
MSRKFVQGIIAGLAVVAFGAVASQSITAHAATLPDNLQGNWYGYLGNARHHHTKYYYVEQIALTDSGIDSDISSTKNADLSDLTSFITSEAKVTFSVKTKHNQTFYQARALGDQSNLGKFRLTSVKVKGVKTPALAWDQDGDTNYAFSKATKARSWDMMD